MHLPGLAYFLQSSCPVQPPSSTGPASMSDKDQLRGLCHENSFHVERHRPGSRFLDCQWIPPGWVLSRIGIKTGPADVGPVSSSSLSKDFRLNNWTVWILTRKEKDMDSPRGLSKVFYGRKPRGFGLRRWQPKFCQRTRCHQLSLTNQLKS